MNYVIEYIKDDVVYKIHDLSDTTLTPSVISAELTQAVNSAGQLTFTVTNDHPCYSVFEITRGEVRVYDTGTVILRADVIGIATDFDGSRTITCEGIAASVLSAPMIDWKVDGSTFIESMGLYNRQVNLYTGSRYIKELFNAILGSPALQLAHRGTGAEFDVTQPEIMEALYTNGSGTVYDAIHKIAEGLGGLISYDYTPINRGEDKIRLVYTPASAQPLQGIDIELGVNLLSLERQQGVENYCNAAKVINTYPDPMPATDLRYILGPDDAPSGYTISQGILYDAERVAEYGMHCETIHTENLVKNSMISAALSALNATAFYDRVSVEVLDIIDDGSDAGDPVDILGAYPGKLNWANNYLVSASANYLVMANVTRGGKYKVSSTSADYRVLPFYMADEESILNSGPVQGRPELWADSCVLEVPECEYAEIYAQVYRRTTNTDGTETWTGPVANAASRVSISRVMERTTFQVGKLVKIKSAPHGFAEPVSYPIQEIRRDLLSPAAVSLTLGQRAITLSGNVIYT